MRTTTKTFLTSILFIQLQFIRGVLFPHGFRVLRISSAETEPERIIQHIEDNNKHSILDVSSNFVDLRIDNNNDEDLLNFLSKEKIPHKFVTEALLKKIDNEELITKKRSVFASLTDPSLFTLDNYHTHLEINLFLKSLANKYSSIGSIFSAGYSFQGRQLLGIQLGTNSKNPGIWIDAGATARNWIGPASAVFVASQLSQKYNSDSSISSLLQRFTFYILPVTNPDGYDYTWTNDRTWIKSRNNSTCTFWSCCPGVNLNRNWNIQWGGVASSKNPCSSTYQGSGPFSEPETAAISTKLKSLRLSAYFSYDGYGELLQYPFSYARNTFPKNYKTLISIGTSAVRSISSVHNTAFRLENAADTSLYTASGFPTDWAKGVLGINLTYTIQSRPSNIGGTQGYILKQSQIIPSAEETFQGIKFIVNQL